MRRIMLPALGAAGLGAILIGGLAPPETGNAAASGATSATRATPAAPLPGVALVAASDTALIPADQVFAGECGACHMPYPPGLLPARSWQAVMAGLADHFGEDASLDPDTAGEIADYLAAHAADAGGRSPRVLRGLAANDVPLRITDTPWWRRAHDQVSARSFERADIKSKSNCIGCHGPAAIRGVFEDD